MVNIIIPVYNARETLPAALDSLVAQTKKLFMVTLSQDGDNEDYSDIIETYTARGLNIKLINSEKNEGPGAARQKAMDNDTMSEYFMFMDSDDMLMPRAVEVLTREAKLHDADFIASDFIAERNHQPAVTLKAENTPITWCHGKIYKAKYLRDNNIRFAKELRLNEDSYFNLVAGNCTTKRLKLPELTYLWRDNPNSLTRAGKENEFFKKSWDQYILSQCYGARDIIRITGKIDESLLAATIMHIYEHYMQADFLKLDLNKISGKLLELGKNPVIKDSINTEQFWRYIQSNLKASCFCGTTLIFFDKPFNIWVVEKILGENK